MWDDIVIGHGSIGTTTFCNPDYDFEGNSISQNSRGFRLSFKEPEIGLTIMRDTKEGMGIASFIDRKDAPSALWDYVWEVVIRNINPADFRQIILDKFEDKIAEGEDKAKREFREWLGI